MMPTADLADIIRRTLAIELSPSVPMAIDRLTAILVARIETRDAQLADAFAVADNRRTRAELLEALRVERHQPVPRRPEQRAVRANPDTPDVIAARRAVLEQIPADDGPEATP